MERVLAYISQQLALYMKENQFNQLYEHIRMFQYVTEEECQLIQNPVTIDSQIKSIDLMHFGWNIGNAFGKPRLQTATFIKKVFAHYSP
ncbi:hypothetical protein GPL10_10260 [Bacteroides fragilis]|nr:hypothetical protein [Bacteroides fragilis]MBT9906158.1 hypothetical protein [Bacteroides fragilis]RDT77434.1 hypothetical protein DWS34_08315 [Bacteroides fragilis]